MRLKDWFKSGLQYAAIIIFASAIYGVLMEPTNLDEMVSMAAMYMLLFGGAMSLLFSISVYKVMLPVSLGFGSTRREAFVGIQCYRGVYMVLVSAAAVGLYLLGGKMGLTELKVLAPIGIGLMPLMTAVGAVIGMVGSRFGKGVPSFGTTTADIEKSVRTFVDTRQMPQHFYRIFNIKEIAFEFTVGIFGIIAFEKPHLAGGCDLFKCPQHHTAHIAFVELIGSVNIGKFAADQLIQPAAPLGVKVKHLLAVTVHVQRPEFFQRTFIISITVGTVSVSGTTGSVNHPDMICCTKFSKFSRITEIIVDQI
jgi:hypothetical protein